MTAGLALPHDAAPLHVTGQARYIDDLPTPAGTLHLAFGLSSVAHGRITAMDLSAVRGAAGVVAVYSAADFADMPDCSPSAQDEPLLATGTVHYIGQPVFLVVATSHHAASATELFSAEEWQAFRQADVQAARAIVVLMLGIFCIGIVLYTIVAATL